MRILFIDDDDDLAQRDVIPLARHLLARAAALAGKNVIGFSPAAERALTAYAWPGKVAELESCIERAVALAVGDRITEESLPKKVREAVAESEDTPPLMTLDEVERRHVARILTQVGGNKSEAARVLGVPRKSLYRKLARWNTRRAS